MNAREFLDRSANNDDLLERLIYLDTMIMYFHQSGRYATLPLSELEIYNDGIKLDSFKNRFDYLKSNDSDEIGYNINGDLEDLQELCLLGIRAYNGFNMKYDRNMAIMNAFKDESMLEQYLKNVNIPQALKEYYKEVLVRNKKIYLNQYMKKEQEMNSGEEKGRRLAKHLPGFGDNNDEAAYVNTLIIPSIVALLYLTILSVYFIYFR